MRDFFSSTRSSAPLVGALPAEHPQGVPGLVVLGVRLGPGPEPLAGLLEVGGLGVNHPDGLKDPAVLRVLLQFLLVEARGLLKTARLEIGVHEEVLRPLVGRDELEVPAKLDDGLLGILHVLLVEGPGLVEGQVGEPGIPIGLGPPGVDGDDLIVFLNGLQVLLGLIEVVGVPHENAGPVFLAPEPGHHQAGQQHHPGCSLQGFPPDSKTQFLTRSSRRPVLPGSTRISLLPDSRPGPHPWQGPRRVQHITPKSPRVAFLHASPPLQGNRWTAGTPEPAPTSLELERPGALPPRRPPRNGVDVSDERGPGADGTFERDDILPIRPAETGFRSPRRPGTGGPFHLATATGRIIHRF